jgi:alpha-beta hydrolase superfamily lysophospholipase
LTAAGCAPEPLTLESLFLNPNMEIGETPAGIGFRGFEERFVPVAEDRHVSIWHVKAENARGLVVVLPGADSNKSRYLIGLPVFIPHGYDVILMDYEGFGASTAAPLDLDRLVEHGLAVVRYAQSQHERIVAFGISTGAPIAVAVAKQLELSGVILEAPLVLEHEVELWLRDNGLAVPVYWQFANAWLHPRIPESFDILEHITGVEEPKLIMHSVEDEVVPYLAGQMVYDAAAPPKTFFEMEGGHGRMVEVDPERYTQTIIRWLNNRLSPE